MHMNPVTGRPDSGLLRPGLRTIILSHEGTLALLANLGAFLVCAWFAFARNFNALFYHFDGTCTFVEIRNQLLGSSPFSFANDYLQGIGNIQFLQNAEWLFFFWPIAWFDHLEVGKLVVYLIVAAIVFLSAYGMARLFSLKQPVALTAGWILGVLAAPFVPLPFFYPILWVAPGWILMLPSTVIGLWLLRAVGRSSFAVDVLAGLGILGCALYLLSANPAMLMPLGPGAVLCVVLALLLVRRRSELLRKLAVLATVSIVAVCLGWPWFLLGLFSATAPFAFPSDFTVIYGNPIFVSIFFHGPALGWAGPALVVAAFAGAVLSLRRDAGELRVAAWVLMAILTALIGVRLLFLLFPRWIFPPPLYFEIAAWPFYALFAAVALHRGIEFVTNRLAGTRLFAVVRDQAIWILPIPAVALTALLATMNSPTAMGYPFPPQLTPIVEHLRANIALDSHSRFNGRVATILPVTQNDDSWIQQFQASALRAGSVGNDELSAGLWYYRIPTLFEYNAFISPAFHALIKRALQRPPAPHQRNVTIFTHPDPRILRLLGVRYLIMKEDEEQVGEQRAIDGQPGQRWRLSELSEPNLATYSPTSLEVRRSLGSTLDFVLDEAIDLSRSAVAQREVGGPLVALQSSSLEMTGGDLHIKAQSTGRSLVVVPLEFSHCIELRDRRAHSGAPKAELIRVDGLLTGVLFEHDLDAVLAFRTGPLRNPTCRWQDYQDLKEMLR